MYNILSWAKYYILCSPDGTKKCEPHDIPAQAEFPKVWDWIMQAEYHEFTDHRTNKTYDAWEAHVNHTTQLYTLAIIIIAIIIN